MADLLETESAEALLSFKNGGFKVKRELDFGDDSEQANQAMTLGPEMFGLKRISDVNSSSSSKITGSTTSNPITLNRRGIPARIRKKNPLFFDDDTIVNQSTNKSPRKSTKSNSGVSGSSHSNQLAPQVTTSKIIKRGHTRSAPGSATGTPERRSGSNASTPLKTTNRVKAKLKKMKVKPAFKLPEKQKSEPLVVGRRARSIVAAAALPSVAATTAEQEAEDLKKLGVRLRNLLKLPKAHKWVCYEWFYSNLDQALFEGDNDFMLCLRESFPSLKLRQLTRSQWCTIRRLMGRPRRCSQAFFNEERGELAKKRQKIRLVQQRKVSDMASLCRDLPDLIPMPLVIGTKVTARLRQPQDGLFVGQIDAVDTSNNTYRITFDRQGLGTHSVPDYEVLSNETVDMISISSLAQRFRPRPAVLPPTPAIIPLMASQQQTLTISSQHQQPIKQSSLEVAMPTLSLTSHVSGTRIGHTSHSDSSSLVSDPVLGSSNSRLTPQETTFGSLPIHVLTPIVRLSKILNMKKDKVRRLRDMNTEVERRESVGETVAPDFQRRYARTILDLEELNTELNSLLVKVRQQCHEIAPDSEHGLSPLAGPDSIRQLCYQEARDLVETQLDTRSGSHPNVTSAPIIALVTGLTSLMLQIKCLAESERNAYELQALHDSLDELRKSLDKSNLTSLRNHVLVHVQHIQSGLCNFDHMTPFNGTETNAPAVTSTTRNLPLPNDNDNH
ncbi:protein lin-9 homolog isoform X1 [Daphnia pulex]|uniref:protein lin-9 homolog isoform X1 n=1 Tax=Daphnia pulex TaxID=6669 RepID=UPI001EDFAFA8|nr:protein lin-9 homolog isoform X1 [Daphnia pulex]XP_046640437.1 protein lin-9 homolog isoform X1 [Daphnia pulicaria]